MNNNPVLIADPKGDFGFIGAAFGAAVGALGGALYGIAAGKSGKEILALAAGGAVGGAFIGSGAALVAGATGALIGTTGSMYVIGGASIAGGIAGNLTEQSIKNIGTNNSIDGIEVVISGVMGIPEAILGGAGDVVLSL